MGNAIRRRNGLLAVILVSLSSFAIAADQPHVDSTREFSVLVPHGWTLESFPIGPTALRMEIAKDGLYASCSITVVDTAKIPKDQIWIDQHVNGAPMDNGTLRSLVKGIESASGEKLSAYYASQLGIGGKKSRAMFYSTEAYSERVKSNLYTQALYTYYVRTSSQLGVTCLGGGVSRTIAQDGFETYNKTFTKILSSIKTRTKGQ